MKKEQVLEEVQRLRDVAQRVLVCGKTETNPHTPSVISVICEMELSAIEWIRTLDEELKEGRHEKKGNLPSVQKNRSFN